MGLLKWLFHRETKREFAELLGMVEGYPLNGRAVLLLFAFRTSSIRVSPDDAAAERLAAKGVDHRNIEKTAIRVFHYCPSNQSALVSLEREAIEASVKTEIIAFKLHKLTNIATVYPEYEPQVRELWETFFEAADNVSTVFEDLRKGSPSPSDFERDFRTDDEYRAGLRLDAFLNNPRGLTPHFLISGSPITKHLRQLADQFGPL